MVQEQRAVVEEEGEVVEEVAGQQHLARGAVTLELRLVNVETQSPAAEEIEDQEGGVEGEAERGRVPDEDVAHEVHLVVGVLGDVVRDAAGEEGPLRRVAGEVVVLDVLLVGDQHLELQLRELVPEGELGLGLGDQLVGHHLLLDGGLVLVVLGVAVLLHVPHGVRLVDVAVRGDLVLHEAPLGVILPREPQRRARVHVHQPDLGVDCVPHLRRKYLLIKNI